jgi:ferredoxin
MCEFCTQHGDGKRWYLEASTYAYDLKSDLERRGYMIDFVRGFEERMPRNVRLLHGLQRLPGPLRDATASRIRESQKRDHFGQPVPIEECERILSMATSIVQLPCVCRHFAKRPERGYCLAITLVPIDDVLEDAFADFADGPDTSKLQRLDPVEAMDVLRRCEAEGMMHSVWTFKTPFIAGLCNCNLESGCMAMRLTREFEVPNMWRGEWVAQLDEDACTACGACVPRCPFGALSNGGPAVTLDVSACWGCGTCRSVCWSEALRLVDRREVPEVAALW